MSRIPVSTYNSHTNSCFVMQQLKGTLVKKRTCNKHDQLNFDCYCAEDSLQYAAQFLYLVILLFTPIFKRPVPISDNSALHPKPRSP